jgi:hypothetical protein
MKSFIRKHSEGFLFAGVILLIGVMIGSFIWTIVFTSESVNSVFELPSSAVSVTSFNLSGAQHLNLRGLVP